MKSCHIFKVEIGDEGVPAFCSCCDKPSYTAHGFVYKNEDAYGVYYAAWSNSHENKFVVFALALGDWDASPPQTTCFGVKIFDGGHQLMFSFVNPEEIPWKNSELLGNPLTREEATTHPLKNEALEILECILQSNTTMYSYIASE